MRCVAIAILFAGLAACGHAHSQQGALAAAAPRMNCEESRLRATQYDASYATIEGCSRQGHFMFLGGEWRMASRCEQRETPSIPSRCSPNRGGQWTCVVECRGLEECAGQR